MDPKVMEEIHKLYENTKIRGWAEKRLKARTDLASELKKGLQGAERFHVLDAIAQLGLTEMLPELIRLSETDREGLLYLTLNALISPDTKPALAPLYKKRLSGTSGEALSELARTAMLDGLALMKEEPPEKDFKKLMKDSSFEGADAGSSAGHAWKGLLLDDRPQSARNAPANHPCQKDYRKLYEDAAVDFHVYFGYKDARPAPFVGDRYEMLALKQYLTAPCSPSRSACGFRVSEKNSELLTKKISGPDGKSRDIRLHLLNSAVGPDDRKNRKNDLQRRRTGLLKKKFEQALKEGDVVLYIGHSRDGGGPDFSPPVLRNSGDVDFSHYRTKKPGEKELFAAFENGGRNSGAKMIALIACHSDQHFAAELQRLHPEGGLLTVRRLLHFTDSLILARDTLEALLGMKCRENFFPSGHEPELGRIHGFFTESRPENRN